MPKMRWLPGSAPDPAGGAHDAPPDPLVGWGGGHPPQSHPSRRLWRLDSRAFGAQLLWPPMYIVLASAVHTNVKSWLRP